MKALRFLQSVPYLLIEALVLVGCAASTLTPTPTQAPTPTSAPTRWTMVLSVTDIELVRSSLSQGEKEIFDADIVGSLVSFEGRFCRIYKGTVFVMTQMPVLELALHGLGQEQQAQAAAIGDVKGWGRVVSCDPHCTQIRVTGLLKERR